MTEGASEAKNIGLTLIIIFVLVIATLTLFPSTRDKAFSIFDDTFDFIKETFGIGLEVFSEGSREGIMKDTFDNFVTSVKECDKKLCDSERGHIYEGSYIIITNQGDDVGLALLNDDGTYGGLEEISNLNIGILTVTKEDGQRHLSCIYPELYQIKTSRSTDPDSWIITYEDEEIEFSDGFEFYYGGAEYSTNIYEIYKKDNKVCLVTNLITEEYEGDSEIIFDSIDFSEQTSSSEYEYSLDSLLRYLSYGGIYETSEWITNEYDDFPVYYYECDVSNNIYFKEVGGAPSSNCQTSYQKDIAGYNTLMAKYEGLYLSILKQCEEYTQIPRTELELSFSINEGSIDSLFEKLYYSPKYTCSNIKTSATSSEGITMNNAVDTILNSCDENKCQIGNVFPTDHYLKIHNNEDDAVVKAFDTNDRLLFENTYDDKIGLLAKKEGEDNTKLGCIFPETFTINDRETNKWSVNYNDIDYNVIYIYDKYEITIGENTIETELPNLHKYGDDSCIITETTIDAEDSEFFSVVDEDFTEQGQSGERFYTQGSVYYYLYSNNEVPEESLPINIYCCTDDPSQPDKYFLGTSCTITDSSNCNEGPLEEVEYCSELTQLHASKLNLEPLSIEYPPYYSYYGCDLI